MTVKTSDVLRTIFSEERSWNQRVSQKYFRTITTKKCIVITKITREVGTINN